MEGKSLSLEQRHLAPSKYIADRGTSMPEDEEAYKAGHYGGAGSSSYHPNHPSWESYQQGQREGQRKKEFWDNHWKQQNAAWQNQAAPQSTSPGQDGGGTDSISLGPIVSIVKLLFCVIAIPLVFSIL